MPQQDDEATELKKTQEVLGFAFPSGDQPPEVEEPGENSLDLPASFVAAQRPAILRVVYSRGVVRSDELDVSFFEKSLV